MSKCCEKGTKDFCQIEESSKILQTISEPKRMEILCTLLNEEICVCDLAERLDSSHNLISHHLKTLYELGILDKKREGNNIYYYIKEQWKGKISDIFSFLSIK